MNNFDDFDSDSDTPQGVLEDDVDAELMRQAELEAEEQQYRDDDAADEYEASLAEQRRLEEQRRDDDQRMDDQRRQDDQQDADRRADDLRAQERAENERIVRQAELDAGLDFGGVDEAMEKFSEGERITQEAQARHNADMAAHREQQAKREADQALADDQAKNTAYRGGFVDIKGNHVSAQDVNAIMANHQAAGGHQAAQERFGLANNKGAEQAAAYYASDEAQRNAAPTAAEQLGPLRDGHAMDNAELLHKADQDRVATAERTDEAERVQAMGTASERQEALQVQSHGALDGENAELLREVDRLNFSNDGVDHAEDKASTDWVKYMEVSDVEVSTINSEIKAQRMLEKAKGGNFLEQPGADQESTSQTQTAELQQDPESQQLAELAQRLNDPSTPEGRAALEENTVDWVAQMRESEAEQERQREREAQNQDQGFSRSA